MEREFKLNELPENIANSDVADAVRDYVKETLTQHTTFVQGGYANYISPDQLDERVNETIKSRNELNENKKVFKTNVLAYLETKKVPEANREIVYDASQVKYNPEDKNDTWKTTVDGYLKDKPGLLSNTITGVTNKIVIEKDKPKLKEKIKKRFFMSNDDIK